MKLVEVISTVLTSPDTSEALALLAGDLGKTPVQVSDRAGFIVNALLVPYLNHAVRLLETAQATREDIDTAATAGLGLPMGPLTLLDLIGLDTSLAVLRCSRPSSAAPGTRPRRGRRGSRPGVGTCSRRGRADQGTPTAGWTNWPARSPGCSAPTCFHAGLPREPRGRNRRDRAGRPSHAGRRSRMNASGSSARTAGPVRGY